MSISLVHGTKPAGLEVKTWGPIFRNIVFLGDYEISMEDFLFAVEYVLTNADLEPDDPRIDFVKRVQLMQEAPGLNPERMCLRVPR